MSLPVLAQDEVGASEPTSLSHMPAATTLSFMIWRMSFQASANSREQKHGQLAAKSSP